MAETLLGTYYTVDVSVRWCVTSKNLSQPNSLREGERISISQ